MPLITLLLFFMAVVYIIDRRIFLGLLYVALNLWLPVLFLASAEALTSDIRQLPWSDPAGTPDTVLVYLLLLSAASALLQFFLCRELGFSRRAAFLPLAGAAAVGVVLFAPPATTVKIAAGVLILLLLGVQIVLFALNLKKIF